MSKISVIIPAHNEAGYIERAIGAFQKQTLKAQEIIVVCDACTDNTAQLAKKMGAIVIKKNYRNVAKTRNAGIKKAKGDILVLQDADSQPARNYLEEITTAVANGAVYGGAKLITKSWRPSAHIHMWIVNSLAAICGGFQGSSFFATKQALAKTKLYNPDLPWAEDWDLSIQLKKIGRWQLLTNTHVLYSERKMVSRGYWREYFRRIGKLLGYGVYKAKKTLTHSRV